MLNKTLEELKPFLDCKETEEYLKIVSKNFDGRGEIHHILPESIFPEFRNCRWNLVNLSYADHYRVHELLPFMLVGAARGSMLYAWNLMKNRSSGELIDAEKYADLRRIHSDRVSKQIKENQPMHREDVLIKFIGKKRPEHAKMMKENNPSKREDVRLLLSKNNPMKLEENKDKFRGKNNPNFGKTMSAEQKEILRQTKIGTSVDQHVKDKISNSMKGKTTTKVNINEIIYDSVSQAAEELGVNRHTISRWIKSGKAHKLLEQRIGVIIDGVKYESISQASQSLGLTRASIKSMIKHNLATTTKEQ